MPVIGLRELSRETSKVIQELLSNGEPVVITKQGQPVATLTPVHESKAQDLVLSLAPTIRETSTTRKVDVSPTKTLAIDDVSKQLREEAAKTPEGRKALAKLPDDSAEWRSEVLAEIDDEIDHVLFEDASLAEMDPVLMTSLTASLPKVVGGALAGALASAAAIRLIEQRGEHGSKKELEATSTRKSSPQRPRRGKFAY